MLSIHDSPFCSDFQATSIWQLYRSVYIVDHGGENYSMPVANDNHLITL